jgi:hypothetical protein
MQLVRPFLLTLVFLCQSAAIAAAAEVKGEGRLITLGEAASVVHHYRSVPGAGVVKGEGRLITSGEAADVVYRYRSVPGAGVVKGEGRLITQGEAADVVYRYRSVPGAGIVKGEGRLITSGEAADVVYRYRSVPGAGIVKGEGRLITHGEAADVVYRYRSVPGAGIVKGEGRLITHSEAADVVYRYRSVPGAGVVKGEGRLITHSEAAGLVHRYQSLPGGLILEGNALGLEWVKTARYDPALNAFVLNGLVVYQSPISSHGAAILARALAEDDRIGVSLAEESHIVYGRLPASSGAATDLKLADGFLGDLILPPRDWTVGYRFAEGFVPRDDVGQANATVLFRFRDFRFVSTANKLELEAAQFDARVVPALEKRAADGGYLPDLKAISSGGGLAPYEANAKHVGANISYYLQERIVARALDYGEVAAFFRTLKASGVDLRDLMRGAEPASGKATARSPTPEKLERDWAAYLIEIQAAKAHANWSAPPYDLYVERAKGASVKKSRATTPSEAKAKTTAADPAVADCLLLWSRDTHMTKQEWSRSCQRAKERVSGS